MPAPVKTDDIQTFLPGIPAEEYERRVKLRGYRNIATDLIGKTDCGTARGLAWIVIEYAAASLYAPAPLEWLDQINKFARRLLLTAMQAEEMDKCSGVPSDG